MPTNITLGQFLPGESVVHRLDPRIKILLMILYIVIIFVVRTLPVFVLPALLLAAMFLLAQVPASYFLSSVKPLRFLLVFMFLLNLFFTPGETVLWQWRFVVITREALRQAIFFTVRLVLLVSGTSMLTLTTSPIALTDGMERLLQPLKILHFPAHELAMMMTIALRFIPTLIEETDKIMSAQKSRGADIDTGSFGSRIKALVPILVPLFISSFRRADELALAMECRCYRGGEGRTRLKTLKFQRIDLVAAILFLIALALVIASNYVFPAVI